MVAEAATKHQCFFLCGKDDYLVDREGRKLYEKYGAGLADDFSREIIDAEAQNVGKVEPIIRHFIQSAQTPSLFGEKKVVWLRGINFLADSPIGRSEGTKTQVEILSEVLQKLNYSTVCVIITASPVDGRTRGFKALKSTAIFQLIGDEAGSDELSKIVFQECQVLGLTMTQEAVEALLTRVNGNSRLLIQEIQKLATFLGKTSKIIDHALVTSMVSQFGEGDFFEFSEAFFSLDLNWTLDVLTRYFFIQKESRPLITSLFNRLRLMIQLRVLLDAGSIEASSYGLNKNTLGALADEYNLTFDGSQNKSSFNVFSQNPWYLGKLAVAAEKTSLKKLLDFEQSVVGAFEKILEYSLPQEQEAVMRQLVIKCLGYN